MAVLSPDLARERGEARSRAMGCTPDSPPLSPCTAGLPVLVLEGGQQHGRVSPSPQSANSRCSLAQQFPSTFDAASAMSFRIWTCMTHPPRVRVTRTLLRPRVRSCSCRPRIRVRGRPDNPAQSSHRVSHQRAEGHAKAQPRPGRTARRFLRGAFPGADVISVFTLSESFAVLPAGEAEKIVSNICPVLHRRFHC